MELNFYPVITNDGSIGLFNTEVDDIYHSSKGAYTEAIEKFIAPSSLKQKLKEVKTFNFLDICFGIGYNSMCAIEKILETNFEGIVYIDALEIDYHVVAFSILKKNKPFKFDILSFLDFSIFENLELFDSIFKIIEDKNFDNFLCPNKIDFFIKNKNVLYKNIHHPQKSSYLHNIYYRYVSERNNETAQTPQNNCKISLLVHLADARQKVSIMETKYDLIFLDAFTPIKLPTLWSVEFFKVLNDLLTDEGNITTYSNSAAIRNGMLEAGLFIGKTEFGTIAYKNIPNNFLPLDEKSLGLMQTKAGIPFYDPELNESGEEILSRRKKMIEISQKQSSSQFLKKYQI